MAPERQASIEVAGCSLGVDNLPGRIANLAGGMIYSVVCEQQAMRLLQEVLGAEKIGES